jgi:diphosphomevalonate decarboxylase
MPHEMLAGSATARANIALAKYWGKSDVDCNLPAVPSISLTLDELVTETRVVFDPSLRDDRLELDGKVASAAQSRRVCELLDRVRARAGFRHRAEVTSTNHFPTAAGLASSASGFSALAGAACRAAQLQVEPSTLSAIARKSSASAARSVFGGFVELESGKPGDDSLCATPVAPKTHWDVRMVIALTATGPKSVGSTEAMERSRLTSPYYDAWVAAAPGWARAIKKAIAARDLESLGEAMEQSTLAFHCCAITSQPSTLYWGPGTMAALQAVRALRDRGVPVWSTMDAGPHVKALCEARDVACVQAALEGTPEVIRVIVASPGSGISVAA